MLMSVGILKHDCFADRREAGRLLGEHLAREYTGRSELLVLGLPRGGVPVAFEVARMLAAPLDVLPVRKLGVPGQEELAFGALGPEGVRVLNRPIVHALELGDETIAHVSAQESEELERRLIAYRGDRVAPKVAGRTVIVVDDGLATGATMLAAVAWLRRHQPTQVVVAVPVGAPETCRILATHADAVVCLRTPEDFHAVGLWYWNFGQTEDSEVLALLAEARERGATPG
jgi:putative phosphoribosyl transferase